MTRSTAVITVSRPNFFVVAALFAVAYGAFATGDWQGFVIHWPVVLAGGLLGCVSHAIGSQINCLTDRELDRRYKIELARAVDEIGLPALSRLISLETLVGIGLAIVVAIAVDKVWLVGLWVIGWLLAVGYSVEPIRLKRRGLLNPLCLVTVIYCLPITFGYAALNDSISPVWVMLAGGLGAQLFALLLMNETEDVPEDVAYGIETPCVRYGIGRVTLLSLLLFAGASIPVFAGFLIWIEQEAAARLFGLLYFSVIGFVVADLVALLRITRKSHATESWSQRSLSAEVRRIAGKNRWHWLSLASVVAIGSVLGL